MSERLAKALMGATQKEIAPPGKTLKPLPKAQGRVGEDFYWDKSMRFMIDRGTGRRYKPVENSDGSMGMEEITDASE